MRLHTLGVCLVASASLFGHAADDEEKFNVHEMIKSAVANAGAKAPVPKGCFWRQTASCSANGRREADKDVQCEKNIPKGASGYCDCNGDGYLDGEEQGWGCHEAPVNCRGYCGIGMPPGGEGPKVTTHCVSEAVQAKWRQDFTDSVATMLQKTKRGMQNGLKGVASSMIDLVDGCTCGDLKSFAKFKDQAERLRVLASVRSLGKIDAKVKYEPLKALMVGDADIHSELNALIIAWQLKKGAAEVGRAFTDLLNDFEEEEESEGDDVADAPKSDAPAPPPPPVKEDHHDSKDVRTVHFWAEALSTAFAKYGDPKDSITKECLTEEAARKAGDGLEAGFNTMLEKNRRSMSKGLKLVANDVIGIVDSLEVKCAHLKKDNKGPERMRNSANRMVILSGAKTIVNFAKNVEYEAMKALKIGGIDVHSELNRFILAWINNKGSVQVGEGMADFFEDFHEQEEDEEADQEEAEKKMEEAKDLPPIMKMVFDMFKAGGEEIKPDCLQEGAKNLQDFTDSINEGIEHMLKKRQKTMQAGLKELADATDTLISTLPRHCSSTRGAVMIHKATKKVRKLTRRTLVDYGNHIKYEAMKSLQVGGVAIHSELNNFIGAWKLRSIKEAGHPFGELFKKLSTIEGHDEL